MHTYVHKSTSDCFLPTPTTVVKEWRTSVCGFTEHSPRQLRSRCWTQILSRLKFVRQLRRGLSYLKIVLDTEIKTTDFVPGKDSVVVTVPYKKFMFILETKDSWKKTWNGLKWKREKLKTYFSFHVESPPHTLGLRILKTTRVDTPRVVLSFLGILLLLRLKRTF